MNRIPRVTVILTSYNHERFIAEAIKSVLSQNFENFELIIADDCSTDKSWKIISSFEDSRIKIFKSKVNERGLINKVLKSGLIHGEYVAIHHSDDSWEKEKLGKQVEVLDNHPEVGAVFTLAKIIDANGRAFSESENLNPTIRAYISVFNQRNKNRHEWLNRFFQFGNCLCHPSVMLRKSCYDTVGFYDLYYRQLPDFDFWIRLCLHYEIFIIQEKLVQFRIIEKNKNTSAQTTESLARTSFESFQILQHLLEIQDKEELLKIFPEMRKYKNNGELVTAYALARIAIESNSKELNLFGMLLLGQKMKDEVFRNECQMKHGFQLSDFHKIIGFKNIILAN